MRIPSWSVRHAANPLVLKTALRSTARSSTSAASCARHAGDRCGRPTPRAPAVPRTTRSVCRRCSYPHGPNCHSATFAPNNAFPALMHWGGPTTRNASDVLFASSPSLPRATTRRTTTSHTTAAVCRSFAPKSPSAGRPPQSSRKLGDRHSRRSPFCSGACRPPRAAPPAPEARKGADQPVRCRHSGRCPRIRSPSASLP